MYTQYVRGAFLARFLQSLLARRPSFFFFTSMPARTYDNNDNVINLFITITISHRIIIIIIVIIIIIPGGTHLTSDVYSHRLSAA